MYKHPGVYVEHIPSGVLSIEAASTSVACFIGPALRGPVDEPVMILNRGAFAEQFGTLDDGTSGIRDFGDTPDYFGHAVNAFYDNGGQQAYIVRVATKDQANPATAAEGALLDPADPAQALYIKAANPGAWGDKLVVTLEPVDPNDLSLDYVCQIGFETVESDGSLALNAIETFAPVNTDPTSGRYLRKILQDRSQLVNCEHKALGGAGGGPQTTALKSGSLRGLNAATLKGTVLNLLVTGTEVVVAFGANGRDVTSTIGAVNHVHTAAAALVTAADVADALETALRMQPALANLNVRLTADQEMFLVPPADPANAPVSVTLSGVAAGGAAAPLLKLDNAGGGGPLRVPAQNKALFLPGNDGATVKAGDYDTAFAKLRDYRNASIILLPGQTMGTAEGPGVIGKAITHAEFMKNRVVIVDPANPAAGSALTTGKSVKDAGFPTSTFATLYYPWMKVNNPHYDADTAANRPITHSVPPSAFAAGMWARIDASRGVWKAPAGLEATVRGAQAPNVNIGNGLQDQLNEWGVNCIRSIIGPSVIWGARTLATKVKPDQRYVPVRRTSAMIGESLYNALQAVVFEPNKHTLWASLRASTSDFMDSLFRAGAFQGEKASEAYYVQCGLGQTMTQGDIDAGIVRLVVGYAPLKPAEFVVVQLKQIVGKPG